MTHSFGIFEFELGMVAGVASPSQHLTGGSDCHYVCGKEAHYGKVHQ